MSRTTTQTKLAKMITRRYTLLLLLFSMGVLPVQPSLLETVPTTAPLTTSPLETDPPTAPLTTSPLATDPLSTSPLATDPSTSSLLPSTSSIPNSVTSILVPTQFKSKKKEKTIEIPGYKEYIVRVPITTKNLSITFDHSKENTLIDLTKEEDEEITLDLSTFFESTIEPKSKVKKKKKKDNEKDKEEVKEKKSKKSPLFDPIEIRIHKTVSTTFYKLNELLEIKEQDLEKNLLG